MLCAPKLQTALAHRTLSMPCRELVCQWPLRHQVDLLVLKRSEWGKQKKKLQWLFSWKLNSKYFVSLSTLNQTRKNVRAHESHRCRRPPSGQERETSTWHLSWSRTTTKCWPKRVLSVWGRVVRSPIWEGSWLSGSRHPRLKIFRGRNGIFFQWSRLGCSRFVALQRGSIWNRCRYENILYSWIMFLLFIIFLTRPIVMSSFRRLVLMGWSFYFFTSPDLLRLPEEGKGLLRRRYGCTCFRSLSLEMCI